jgi:hypothetical protein
MSADSQHIIANPREQGSKTLGFEEQLPVLMPVKSPTRSRFRPFSLFGLAPLLITFVGGVLLLVLCGEFSGTVTKVDPDKNTVVFQQYEKKEKVGDPVELSVKDAKITRAKFDKETMKLEHNPLDGGLKADVFKKDDPEKGVRVRIVADGDKLTKDSKVTEVKLFGNKGGK